MLFATAAQFLFMLQQLQVLQFTAKSIIRRLLEVLKDKSHPEYETYQEWLPEGFNPDHFPLEKINAELESFGAWHRKHPRKKSTPWHQI